MDYKEKYKELISKIKSTVKRDNGKPFRNEDIASRLGYERSYFSSLIGERGEITEKHIRAIEREFAKEITRDGHDHVATAIKQKTDEAINHENYKDKYFALLEKYNTSSVEIMERVNYLAIVQKAQMELLLSLSDKQVGHKQSSEILEKYGIADIFQRTDR